MNMKFLNLILVLCLIVSIYLNIRISNERDEEIDEVNIAWGYIYKLEYFGRLDRGGFERYRTKHRRLYAKRGNSQEG